MPLASTLVEIAHERALRGEWVQVDEVVPMYLRAPDAEINWATRSAQ
jgi:tRNA threonylcarbamoyladenosine biosynthesis protein TsaB